MVEVEDHPLAVEVDHQSEVVVDQTVVEVEDRHHYHPWTEDLEVPAYWPVWSVESWEVRACWPWVASWVELAWSSVQVVRAMESHHSSCSFDFSWP